MKRILVTGAAGQIGSELVPALRLEFGNENVVAASYNHPLTDEITNSGPHTRVDVTNWGDVDSTIQKYESISSLKLREIVVEEQGLCSKSSFYRLLTELEDSGEVDVARQGTEKLYLSKLVKRH